MNISKISSQTFNGLIKVAGDIQIDSKKPPKQLLDNSYSNRRMIKKLFSGSSVTVDNYNDIKLRNISDEKEGYTGSFFIDTDRITSITPDKINLISNDRTVSASINYNPRLDSLRQILALNAYHTAKQDNISVEID